MVVIVIKASKAQQLGLRKGRKVNVKKGDESTGTHLHINESRLKSIMKKFASGKGVSIQLTPEENEENRASNIEGKGIYKTVAKYAKKGLKAALKAGVDMAAPMLSKSLGKTGSDMAKVAANGGIDYLLGGDGLYLEKQMGGTTKRIARPRLDMGPAPTTTTTTTTGNGLYLQAQHGRGLYLEAQHSRGRNVNHVGQGLYLQAHRGRGVSFTPHGIAGACGINKQSEPHNRFSQKCAYLEGGSMQGNGTLLSNRYHAQNTGPTFGHLSSKFV